MQGLCDLRCQLILFFRAWEAKQLPQTVYVVCSIRCWMVLQSNLKRSRAATNSRLNLASWLAPLVWKIWVCDCCHHQRTRAHVLASAVQTTWEFRVCSPHIQNWWSLFMMFFTPPEHLVAAMSWSHPTYEPVPPKVSTFAFVLAAELVNFRGFVTHMLWPVVDVLRHESKFLACPQFFPSTHVLGPSKVG